MGCHSDSHTVTKENQFQEQSLSEEYMFCRHLTEFYSQLPRLPNLKFRIRWSVQEWLLQKENQIFKVQYHPQTRDAGEWWLITSERGWIYQMKRTGPRTEPWGTPQVRSERKDFASFTHLAGLGTVVGWPKGVTKIVLIQIIRKLVKNNFLNQFGHKLSRFSCRDLSTTSPTL